MASERARPGFALPAVLAVTGVVTIVFLTAITALSSLQSEAASARARVRFLQRALTAEAGLAYMAATSPFSADALRPGAAGATDPTLGSTLSADAGGETIRLDGRPYLMDVGGPLIVRLQDTAGLVNLAREPEAVHRRLGERLGLSPQLAASLYPRLLDYVDSDDLRSINGAEVRDYGGQGAPPNRAMLRPSEWLSLLGIRAEVNRKAWSRARSAILVDPRVTSVNVNTLTPEAMAILFDLTPSQIEAVERRREVTPFQSFEEFRQTAGAGLEADPERIYTFPSGQMAFELRDAASAWVYRGILAPTPTGLVRPLWINQTELMEAPGRAAADTTNATRFPYAPD